jgi:hypothetical protein
VANKIALNYVGNGKKIELEQVFEYQPLWPTIAKK